jgi:hypothetical protein
MNESIGGGGEKMGTPGGRAGESVRSRGLSLAFFSGFLSASRNSGVGLELSARFASELRGLNASMRDGLEDSPRLPSHSALRSRSLLLPSNMLFGLSMDAFFAVGIVTLSPDPGLDFSPLSRGTNAGLWSRGTNAGLPAIDDGPEDEPPDDGALGLVLNFIFFAGGGEFPRSMSSKSSSGEER